MKGGQEQVSNNEKKGGGERGGGNRRRSRALFVFQRPSRVSGMRQGGENASRGRAKKKLPPKSPFPAKAPGPG